MSPHAADAPFEGELPLLDGRTQVNADPLLEMLEAQAERGSLLIGLLALDIGSPLFTFFFGRARVAGHTAIVSLARLNPTYYGLPADRALTVRRAVWEMIHELGHVAGLSHCRTPACIMRLANSVDAVDLRGDRFCPECSAVLPDFFRRPLPPMPM